VLALLPWYNRKRMHSTLNYVSRFKFEHGWNNARIEAAA
jgi:putative transposase